ncbi:MAG: DMT family transporter [Desulfovibrionaceae bacterium]
MKWLYVILAVVAGALVPLQAGVNVRLKLALGEPLLAALVSFGVGTLTLAACLVFLKPSWGSMAEAAARGPLWMWFGGCLGAFFVAATIVLAEGLGAASMLAWIIASQLAAGVIMDHYGLVGYAVREMSPMRALGALLLVAGAVLVQKF